MAEDPTINDPYGQDYQEQLFAKLSPQVEAMVARLFPHSRGARFGAQGSILAQRLAALRTEIALDSAKRSADHRERLRREEVSRKQDQDRYNREQAERMRQESERRTENERNRAMYERYARDFQSNQSEQEKAQTLRALKLQYAESPDRDAKVKSAMEYLYPPEPKQPGLFESISGMFKKKPAQFEDFKEPDAYAKQKQDWVNRINAPSSEFAPKSTADKYADVLYPDAFSGPSDRGFKPLTPTSNETVASGGGFSSKGPGVSVRPEKYEGSWEFTNTRPEGLGWLPPNTPTPQTKVWRPLGTDKNFTDKSQKVDYNAAPWDVVNKSLATRNTLTGERFSYPGKLNSSQQISSFIPSASSSVSRGFEDIDEYRLKNQRPGQKDFDPYTAGSPNTSGWNKDLWSGKISPRGFRDTFNNTVNWFKGWA
jgi:hypothetical protein